MPIYEFYCPDCHKLFSFLSRKIDTSRRPPCPDCKRPLRREISIFAHPRTAAEGERGMDADTDPPVDDARLEQAMASMAGDIESVDEDDPRQAARMMRRFSNLSGMRFNESMEEAVERMESGEDPEAIENELGDALESEDPFVPEGQPGRPTTGKHAARGRGAPARDPKLHEMP